MLRTCRATSTVGCAAGRTCPCSPMGTMKCCGIFRGVVTLLGTSACALRHPGGACWISKELHWKKDELERQRESILKGPLVVRDQEYPFAEELISDEAGVIDSQLPVLTKVSCLVDGLKMGGSYGLIERLWAQFVLTAGPVKREVAWTRDEVLLGSVVFRNPFVSFPDSHCCFAFSQLSSLECCLEFCHVWSGGQRLIIFVAWSSRSVASHCGRS